MTVATRVFAIILLVLLVAGMARSAPAAAERRGMLEETKQLLGGKRTEDSLWVTEKTGQFLPLDLEFADERGTVVRLGDIIDRPTIFPAHLFFLSEYLQ